MSCSSGMDGRVQDGEEVEDNDRVFSLLRALCKQLLHYPTGSPASTADVLHTLASNLRDVSSSALQACMEYVLFPLLLLLDSAVVIRSSTSSGVVSSGSATQLPMAITDSMLEGVVVCLEIALQRCFLQIHSQMVTILKSLTTAAMLSPSEASEEIRHGVVRCLMALFQSLKSCGEATCICCLSSPPPLLKEDSRLYAKQVWTRCLEVYHAKDYRIIESCHLASLHLEEMRVAIGHLFSVLLKISEVEANLGAVGSSNLRVDALSTLRVIVWKVGSADALSFFLPGVVSSLSKGIQKSKPDSRNSALSKWPPAPSFTRGASGSPRALVEATRCMGDIIALVLGDSQYDATLCKEIWIQTKKQHTDITVSADAALDMLRIVSLSSKNRSKQQSEEETVVSSDLLTTPLDVEVQRNCDIASVKDVENRQQKAALANFCVARDRKWLQSTAIPINSILVLVVPFLCVHATPAVRLAAVEFAASLLGACAFTLQNCTEILLEGLLSLASDQWKEVALAACSYLSSLVSASSDFGQRCLQEQHDIPGALEDTRLKLQRERLLDIMNRLVVKLPRAIYSADDDIVVLHTRKLAAAMYFAGADAVYMSLLNTPVSTIQFIQLMSQGFSFTRAFSGSMSHLTRRSLNVQSGVIDSTMDKPTAKWMRLTSTAYSSEVNTSNQVSQEKDRSSTSPGQQVDDFSAADQLPRPPPWFRHGGRELEYKNMSCILRLTGLSAVKGHKDGAALTRLFEPLLVVLRQVTEEFSSKSGVIQRMAPSNVLVGTSYHLRDAAVATTLITEILYGASGAWTDKLANLFEMPVFIGNPSWAADSIDCEDTKSGSALQYHFEEWAMGDRNCTSRSIVTCVGDALHEFMGIMDILSTSTGISGMVVSPSGFLKDLLMLEQVLVEGVGVFARSIGTLFDEAGFLGIVLYALLERLGSTDYNVSQAADVVLRTISSHCGYVSVTALVKANADHIVDSLSRQLRHLSIHPNAPCLLAGVLQRTRAAPDLLPLLHEPMRSIQIELEIPARKQHPEYIIPLLLGLREISKAVQVESSLAVRKAKTFAEHVETNLSPDEKQKDHEDEEVHCLLIQLEERNQSSCAIAALAGSCIVTCIPLLSSKSDQACLLALDTVEHSIGCLADLEAVSALDKSTKQLIRDRAENIASSASEDRPINEDGSGDTVQKLLPSMNRLWPHLVLCLRHSKSSVVIRTLTVIARATYVGGGEFFARRMKKDAVPLLIKLLQSERWSGTAGGLLLQRSSETLLIQQKQRGDPHGKEAYSSPAEVLKVQEAVIACVTLIARRSKSASALVGLVGVLASWILGLGCAVSGLQSAAGEALLALSLIDADLVWMLVADLAFGAPSTAPIPCPGLPPLLEIFPPLQAPQDALWLQYTAQKEDLLNVDRTVAWKLFLKLMGAYNFVS